MIRVNLLKTGPQRQITIPFGWIFVAAFAVLVCGFLFVVDQQHKQKIDEKNGELEKVQQTVLRLKKHWTVRKQLKEQHRSLERDFSRYTSLLGQKSSGWTPTLLLFEELLHRAKTVWFRDLRIDGDGRVMINGVSMEDKQKRRFPGYYDSLQRNQRASNKVQERAPQEDPKDQRAAPGRLRSSNSTAYSFVRRLSEYE